MAGGRSSSHATMRSILIAAAIATCCKWVFASPQYRVRRSPNARTPWERVPSMPARCPYCALPSALAYQVRASATASASARGGSPSRRPRRLARVHAARTGHGAHVCVANWTMIGRLPWPPPCSHQAVDRCPWGQRTCCWSQSTTNCSGPYAPSTWACQPWLGRVGPRRIMSCSSQDTVLLAAAADEEFRAEIRGIDEVLAWRHLLLDERLLNRLRTLRFMHRGRRRVDVREEVRGRGLTRLTDVDHVPGPRRVPLLAVARLDIVRGFDACGRGRQLAVLFESHLTHGRHLRGRRRLLCPLVVALPRPAQGLHVRQLAQPRGGFRGLQEVEEPEPILADRVGVRRACGRVLR